MKRVLRLARTPLNRIMVPKVDIVACPVEQKVKEVINLFHETGYSRLPVFYDSIDNIVGIIHLKDIFRIIAHHQKEEIEAMPVVEFVRLPDFIYENIYGLNAFLQMQRQKTSLAIVIDEFGRVVGLITVEDLLEEMVGELIDEFDREPKEPLVKISENQYQFDTKIPIDRFCEIVGIEIPPYDITTLAGLIYHIADRIPKKGERLKFGELEFTILEGSARKITKVLVERKG